MNKKREMYYKSLFLTSAIYDIILGLGFLLFWKPIFTFLNISYPEHSAYIALSATFVFVIGIAYYYVYKNIYANRDLVKVGALYKLAYFLVAIYYFIFNSLPHNIFLIFGLIDFIFLLFFIEFLIYTKNTKK